FADRKLKQISIQGGAPVTLCDAVRPMGASWGEDGSIVAALTSTSGLSRVSAAGGTPQGLSKPERGELTHRYPQVLDGSNTVLFTASASATASSTENAKIEALSLKTGERRTLVNDAYFGRYVPTGGKIGHLIYIQQGTLFGVPFDPSRLGLQGAPAPLLQDVLAPMDFSKTGTFLYQSGNGEVSDQTWQIAWL